MEAAGVVGRAAMWMSVKQLARVGTVCPAIHLQASPAVFAGCELTPAHIPTARLMQEPTVICSPVQLLNVTFFR